MSCMEGGRNTSGPPSLDDIADVLTEAFGASEAARAQQELFSAGPPGLGDDRGVFDDVIRKVVVMGLEEHFPLQPFSVPQKF